jgi:hypothetical protein
MSRTVKAAIIALAAGGLVSATVPTSKQPTALSHRLSFQKEKRHA